jgi:predicted transposase YdaD
MATVAQQLEQRGILKGREQVAYKLLKAGLSQDLIMQTTDLTREELEKLYKNINIK